MHRLCRSKRTLGASIRAFHSMRSRAHVAVVACNHSEPATVVVKSGGRGNIHAIGNADR